jgi:hypothetical protein
MEKAVLTKEMKAQKTSQLIYQLELLVKLVLASRKDARRRLKPRRKLDQRSGRRGGGKEGEVPSEHTPR